MIARRLIGRWMPRHAGLALVAGLAVAGCGGQVQTMTSLPDPPAPVTHAADTPFGDRAAAADEKLAAEIDRLLRPRFGKPREQHFAAPTDVDAGAIEAYYREQAADWQPLPEVAATARAGGGAGFGYARDKEAFVLLIAPATEAGPRPVTVQRYGG